MPNISDSLSLLRQYDVSLTRKIFQDQETRGYNVMTQVISEQSKAKHQLIHVTVTQSCITRKHCYLSTLCQPF